ncbi:hypothetical protein PGIGA_G00175860, partial [Pangasianodon gigas]|nr:hypothetical protein [Pangasianodon gigas]
MATGQDVYSNLRTENKFDCRDSKDVLFLNNTLYEGMSVDEDDRGTHSTRKTLGLNTTRRVVCVVLLCVLLLTAITVLWIKYNNVNTAHNQ